MSAFFLSSFFPGTYGLKSFRLLDCSDGSVLILFSNPNSEVMKVIYLSLGTQQARHTVTQRNWTEIGDPTWAAINASRGWWGRGTKGDGTVFKGTSVVFLVPSCIFLVPLVSI